MAIFWALKTGRYRLREKLFYRPYLLNFTSKQRHITRIPGKEYYGHGTMFLMGVLPLMQWTEPRWCDIFTFLCIFLCWHYYYSWNCSGSFLFLQDLYTSQFHLSKKLLVAIFQSYEWGFTLMDRSFKDKLLLLVGGKYSIRFFPRSIDMQRLADWMLFLF